MSAAKSWVHAGLVAGLLLLPLMHLAAVDLEGKGAGGAAYLARADDRHVSIAMAGGLGMLVAALLLVHLAGLRRAAAGAGRPLLADACTAVGGVAVLGLVLTFLGAIAAAYGADEGYPFEAVRPMGMLAENAGPVLLGWLAGPAALVAVLALRDRLLPRWFGVVAAVVAVLLALLAVLVPGAAALPAIAWLVVGGVVLEVRGFEPMPAVR